ncbi:MAG: D-alanyl-D-alanine carboxypeptidase family protein [Clostridia bacterium]|nr:D-alanyl-D-alanine carboxypeptidase family protein [Clostridia bacterium]
MKKNKPQSTQDMLTEEELRMIKKSVDSDREQRRRLAHYDNSDKAKLVRYVKKNRIFAVVCVILIACVIVTLCLCAAFVIKKMANRENKDDFTIILGDDSYTAKYKDIMRDGILYVDMRRIAEYTGLTVTGSATSVKFTYDDDNYLRFENGSDEAVINGNMVELGGTATVTARICEIPYDFLTKAVGDGLKFTLDRTTNTVKIQRRMYATEDDDVFIPKEIHFYSDAFTVLMGITQVDDDYKYEYSIDVSAFLSSIDPDNAEDYLILANKQNPLGADYTPTDLKSLEINPNSSREMNLRSDAATALSAMILAMRADGITDVFVTSAYRSYSYQEKLFEGYIADRMESGMTREEAEAAVLEFSARPGTSEHQTGLCLDFMTTQMSDLDESFEETAAFRWLSANAHKYGFILRYPSDKVSTTGYKYEPWHYRFVGRNAATEIYESGICLEEYLELN